MKNKYEVGQKIAEFLLQIKAVKLQPNKPFTWSSGWVSPIYCDNRITLSYPSIRTYIRQNLSSLIQEEYGSVGAIAGVATSGIPQGVLVAQQLGLPFVYVRAQAKRHGAGKLIEGELSPGQRVVVVEDLVSTGESGLKVVNALRQAGCDVAGLAAIFSYGFDVAYKNFEAAKCRFEFLSDYEMLIDYALKNNFIQASDMELLRQWRLNPSEWSHTDKESAQ